MTAEFGDVTTDGTEWPIDDLNLKGFNHPILAAEIMSWREEVDNVVDAAAAAARRQKKG